jgi:ankyrin repeat domain-containing protein 50
VFIIIDGLDESASYDKTAEILQEFTNNGTWVVKLLVTARPEPKFGNVLRGFQKIILETKNTPDISSFTSSFLELDMSPKVLRDNYENAIVKRAQNVFLWVRLVRDEVRRYNNGVTRHSDAAFNEFLASLPEKLGEFYQRMLGRVASLGGAELVSISIYMFQLVQYACRPMSLAEFDDALTILIKGSPDSREFELAENRTGNLKDLITRCGGNFIEIRGQKNSKWLFDQCLSSNSPNY